MLNNKTASFLQSPTDIFGGELFKFGEEGQAISWYRIGSGPPLVMLHGGSGSWRHWWNNIADLSQSFTLLLPDLPGFGSSDIFEANTLRDYAAPIARQITAMAGKDYGLVGFSFGGMVAMEIAAQAAIPPRLSLIGSGMGGGRRRAELAPLTPWRHFLKEGALEQAQAALCGNLYNSMLAPAQEKDPFALQIYASDLLAARLRNSREIALSADLTQHFHGYSGALQCLYGTHDASADPAQTAAYVTAHKPQGHVAEILGAGHWAQYQDPKTVNTHIRTWHLGTGLSELSQ